MAFAFTIGLGVACCITVAVGQPEKFSAPQPTGSYVIRIVPETVDLVHSAELAINAMTRTVDSDYRTYFLGHLNMNPPRLGGPMGPPERFLESIPLVRIMTGNLSGMELDDTWAGQGSDLGMVTLYYRMTGSSRWLEMGKQIVDGWTRAWAYGDDLAFIPVGSRYMIDPTYPPELEDYHEEVPTGWSATFNGWSLQAVSIFYRETGYEPARELADRLARLIRYHGKVFDEEGRFIARHNGYLGPKTALHFHHHTTSVLALVEYALATGNWDYAEFARKSYEYARSTGNTAVGFFPEYLENFPDDRHGIIDSEGCVVADMVAIPLKLTEAGVGDYWENVDSYVRNMLTEMQMKHVRWLHESTRSLPHSPVNAEAEDAFQAPERMVGSFAGWSGPNQFYEGIAAGIQQCCLGNCVRALYYVWDRMVHEEQGRLTIELMLNHTSAAADVASDLPYAERLAVTLKRETSLRVRRPSWLDTSTLKVTRYPSGESITFKVEEPYLRVDMLPAGQELIFTFDLPERTVKTRVGHVDATITLRGNEIVAFDPPGKGYPYWQDKPTEQGTTPEVQRTYFIPDQRIHW